MDRPDLVRTIVRLAENLRTVTAHTERQEQAHARPIAQINQLRAEITAMRAEITTLRAEAAGASQD